MLYKIKKSMAITSHLSDIQEMISFGDVDKANLRINFVKMLVHDERTEMTKYELNALWEECLARYK